MKFKDIKIGDKVRLNRNLTRGEVEELVMKKYLPDDTWEYLQKARTVGSKSNVYWESVKLEEDGDGFFWPVELFEPVRSKEEQVQEDIQKIKDIVKRYNLKGTMAGATDTLIGWLERFGQDNLSDGRVESRVESV